MSILSLVGLPPEVTDAPKSMSLETLKGPDCQNLGIRARLQRPPPRHDPSLEVRDIKGATRLTLRPPPERHPPQIVTGSRPKRLIPERGRDNTNKVDDIEGARPKAEAHARVKRTTDPMNPTYTPLDGGRSATPEDTPPVRKFVRDTIDVSDIAGARPKAPRVTDRDPLRAREGIDAEQSVSHAKKTIERMRSEGKVPSRDPNARSFTTKGSLASQRAADKVMAMAGGANVASSSPMRVADAWGATARDPPTPHCFQAARARIERERPSSASVSERIAREVEQVERRALMGERERAAADEAEYNDAARVFHGGDASAGFAPPTPTCFAAAKDRIKREAAAAANNTGNADAGSNFNANTSSDPRQAEAERIKALRDPRRNVILLGGGGEPAEGKEAAIAAIEAARADKERVRDQRARARDAAKDAVRPHGTQAIGEHTSTDATVWRDAHPLPNATDQLAIARAMYPGANPPVRGVDARGGTPACFARAREANGCADEVDGHHHNGSNDGDHHHHHHHHSDGGRGSASSSSSRPSSATTKRRGPVRATLGPEAVFAQARTAIDAREAAAAAATTTATTTAAGAGAGAGGSGSSSSSTSKPTSAQDQQHAKNNKNGAPYYPGSKTDAAAASSAIDAARETYRPPSSQRGDTRRSSRSRPSSAPVSGRSDRSDATSILTTWRGADSNTRRTSTHRSSVSSLSGQQYRQQAQRPSSAAPYSSRRSSSSMGGDTGFINATARRSSFGSAASSARRNSSATQRQSVKGAWEAKARKDEIDAVRALR